MRQSQSRPVHGPVDPPASLLEASDVVATLTVTPEGVVVAANARMRKLLGLGAGAKPADLRLPDLLVDSGKWAAWRDVGAATQPVTLDLRIGTAVHSLRGELRARGAAGLIDGLFVDREDEKMRATLQHSARMEALGSLTTGIAHDFNNLLTVLVGNLYLVGEELRDQPKTFEKLKAARDAGKRGTELIKQLLAFARREELVAEPIAVSGIIEALCPLLRRALGTRITLETQLQDEGPIRANRAQLESVLVNLAVNARDAIEGKGKISIAVRKEQLSDEAAARRGLARAGTFVAISLRDTGKGIAPSLLERVFEPFFSTKGERGGTGLGLSMVRWFAQQAGGAARIDSALEAGTTVTLYLPRHEAAVVHSDEKTMPLMTLPTGNERVTVLAPDHGVRATIHQTLEVLGYRVRLAATAEEMLALVENSDLLMMDGVDRGDADLLVRARGVHPGLRIIVTADAGQRPEKLPARQLVKPFTLADLAQTVRRTLDGAQES